MRVSTEMPSRLTIIPESPADTAFLVGLGLRPESSPLVRLYCSSLHCFEASGSDRWFMVEIRKDNIIVKRKPETED